MPGTSAPASCAATLAGRTPTRNKTMSRSPRLSPRVLRNRINANERTYYANITREYPWPISAILASSPASERSIDAAVRLSRRDVKDVAFDWLLEETLDGNPRRTRAGRVAASPCRASATDMRHSARTWWADGLVSPPQDSGGAFELVVSGGASAAAPCRPGKPDPGDEVVWMISD